MRVVLRGRSAEMTAALGPLRRAVRTGRGGMLLVTGEPGVGKSVLLAPVPAEPAWPDRGWDALTDAERKLAELVSSGHTNRSTASQLGLSPNTVGTHVRSIYSKLHIQSRVQLANRRHEELTALAGAGAAGAQPPARIFRAL